MSTMRSDALRHFPKSVMQQTFRDKILEARAFIISEGERVKDLLSDITLSPDDIFIIRECLSDRVTEVEQDIKRWRILLRRTDTGGYSRQLSSMPDRDEIFALADFRAVAEQYCSCIRGNEHRGMAACPFHEDKSPSLSLNYDKKLWYCFAGCGGGNIIDFVMKVENVDFVSALKILGNYV